MRNPWRPYVLLIAVLLLAWNFWPREKPDVGVSAPLPPAKEVKGEPKAPVHPKAVNAYPDHVKARLDLPEPVAKNPDKKVIATGKLKAEARDYTMTAVLDLGTGDAEVFGRADPLPWIGPGRRGAVGIAYGLTNGEPTGKLYGYHDLLQVKALHSGARGEIDQRGEWQADIYIEYRW